MPVWHERTRAAREAGELVLVGIAEEQHPERCELFARWKGIDWPILWDPFDLTGTTVVPVAVAADEHGIVRHVGLRLDELDEFLAATFDAPSETGEPLVVDLSAERRGPEDPTAAELSPAEAMARLLWTTDLGARDLAACIGALERAAAAEGAGPAALFRLGVARRMRHDSEHALAEDFQAALDLWSEALRRDPAQYVWRRRIQQWGPRLDKPYPFYGWVEAARRDLARRGEPFELDVPLSSSEVAGREPAAASGRAGEARHPDPDGRVPRDRAGLVALAVAAVPHTGGAGEDARATFQAHLVLRPSRERAVRFDPTGPAELWIEDAARHGLEGPRLVFAEGAEPTAPRTLDFTVISSGEPLRGTVLYFVCEGRDGQCLFLARDVEIAPPPR